MSEAITEKVLKGRAVRCTVSSAGSNKSRVGVIERQVKDRKFHKYLKRRTKIMFHDENNTSQVGDVVNVVETAPISKRKKFTLKEVVTRFQG